MSHWLGLDNVAGAIYAFWSGSGSVIIPLVVQALLVTVLFWWHNQCHVHRCWWYARRTTAAGERACWRHHPHPRRTAADIRNAHRAAQAGSTSKGS